MVVRDLYRIFTRIFQSLNGKNVLLFYFIFCLLKLFLFNIVYQWFALRHHKSHGYTQYNDYFFLPSFLYLKFTS